MENPEFRSDENQEFTEESRDSVKLEGLPRDSVEARDSRHSKCSAGHLSVQSDHSSKGFSHQTLRWTLPVFWDFQKSLLKVMSSQGIQKHRKFQMFHPSLKVFDQVGPIDPCQYQRSTEFKDLSFKLHSQSENIFVIVCILISCYSAWDRFYLIISLLHQVCSDWSTSSYKDRAIRTKKKNYFGNIDWQQFMIIQLQATLQ